MRFEIAAIRFDTRNRTLENGSSTIRLEPKPYLLLQTLIAANGDVVSREQLIEKVWQGRIVTESAINKAVSILRQHLNKLDSQTNYIETIPTLGYRLIPKAIERVATTTSPKRKVRFSIVGATVVGLFSALIAFQLMQPSPVTQLFVPEKITGQSGIELQLSSAAGSNSFSYLHPIATPLSELWLHHLGKSRKLLSGNLSAQALSPDASKIAFIDEENGCMVKQLTIAKHSVHPLFSCQTVEKIKFTWSRGGQELIYRKRENIHSGFGLYRYDLNTHKHTQLTLPPSSGNVRGDHLFGLSQSQNLLAVATYLGEDKHRLTLYHYPKMSIAHTIDLPHNLTSLTWSSNGQLIYFSQANNVYSVDAQSQAVTLLHTLTAPIESLTLFDNNDTLLLNQYKLTSNIKLFKPMQNTVEVVVDNQALNRLPRANLSQHIWYISDHGAHSALWSIDTHKEAQTQVPLPHIFNFQRYQLNNDASKILFEYQDAIYQFAINSQKTTQLIGSELKPYVANYSQDNNEIIYSSERSGSWQLWSLNLITNQHQQLTTQGGYSGYKLNNVLYFTKFTQPGIWQLEDGQESVVVTDVPVRNWLNWRLRDNALYYEKDKSIWRFDLKTKQEKLYFTPPQRFIGQFDILQNGDVVFSELKQPSGELWQLTVKN